MKRRGTPRSRNELIQAIRRKAGSAARGTERNGRGCGDEDALYVRCGLHDREPRIRAELAPQSRSKGTSRRGGTRPLPRHLTGTFSTTHSAAARRPHELRGGRRLLGTSVREAFDIDAEGGPPSSDPALAAALTTRTMRARLGDPVTRKIARRGKQGRFLRPEDPAVPINTYGPSAGWDVFPPTPARVRAVRAPKTSTQPRAR